MSRGRFRAPSAVRIVWDGQSMNVSPDAPNNIPTFAMRDLPGIPWINISVAGAGWYDLTPTIATRRDPQVRSTGVDILIMNGGQGDMLNAAPSGQQTAEVCYQRALDYAASARAAGFDYVIGTTWPSIGPIFGRPTVDEQAALDGHNALMLADTESWDAVVDLSTPPFDDATDTTYFAVDRTHLSVQGARVGADRFVALLSPITEAI